MDTTTTVLLGILIGFAITFIFWLINKYYVWVNKVNDRLHDAESKDLFQGESIDKLKARVKKLEDSVSILEKVDEYTRINNTDYNEEGKGSINPSEADTE